MQANHDPDVLILGAGIAGLTAARTLAQKGLHAVILEARDRVGGRIHTHTTPEGVIVELGAEFVHGRAPELWSLLEECGVRTVEREGSMLREEWNGNFVEDKETETGDLLEPLNHLARLSDDVSFADWLRVSDVPADERPALLGYVEGFNAADPNRISAKALGIQQKAEDSIEGGRTWHLRGGYAQIAEYLREQVQGLSGELRLNCIVRSIEWSAGEVRVETSTGSFRAPKCVITLPLGVLQCANREGGLRFQPEVSALAAARRLAMGHASRFTMLFRERWWESSSRLNAEALHTMSFLFTSRRTPPVWWTAHPESTPLPTLTGWAGGRRASEITGRDAGDLACEACRSLAEVFGVQEGRLRSLLVSAHTHDWSTDPFALGAYNYVPVGALDAPATMAQPESATLFFAGEHTDTTGYWGTVHAALRSGLRVAEQVLKG